MEEDRARKRILSIDGGGIRGIIPLCVLAKLEAQLKAQRGESVALRDVFGFVAGTSTGAIIAAGIAAGIPAAEMLDLYLTRVGEVFPLARGCCRSGSCSATCTPAKSSAR